jgi:hypothetical protein
LHSKIHGDLWLKWKGFEEVSEMVKRALLSVSDKTGIVEFARSLHTMGVELISTGGTEKAIKDAGIPVKNISEVTVVSKHCILQFTAAFWRCAAVKTICSSLRR